MPRIGGFGGAGDWGNCDPSNPKNCRRRVSVLVEQGGHVILIDTGPDLREQLLSARVSRIDAVFLTHDHADHAHGIDDLRQVFHVMGTPVACFASPATWAVLRPRFGYVFEGTKFYPPTCTATDLQGPVTVGGMMVTPFQQIHGNIDSTGYRIEHDGRALAYSTDVKALDSRADAGLAGLDLWIVDALRRNPHPTHSHLAQTLDWVAHYRPKHTVLTHMDQSMDYATLCNELPPGVEAGYDGQVLTIPRQ